MNALREEIVEDVKTLIQLNKLKITLFTGLAAVTFGIAPNTTLDESSPVLLTLVPLICLYCDSQFFNTLSKIFTKATFIRNSDRDGEINEHAYYERFIKRAWQELSPNIFSFESIAQIGTSIVLMLFSPILAVLFLFTFAPEFPSADGLVVIYATSICSFLGLVVFRFLYLRHKKAIDELRTWDEELDIIRTKSFVEDIRQKGEEAGIIISDNLPEITRKESSVSDHNQSNSEDRVEHLGWEVTAQDNSKHMWEITAQNNSRQIAYKYFSGNSFIKVTDNIINADSKDTETFITFNALCESPLDEVAKHLNEYFPVLKVRDKYM